MLDWTEPWLLLLLGAIPVLRWLHRQRSHEHARGVAALFLWPAQDVADGQRARRREPDPRWRLRALIAAALALAAAGPRVGSPAPGAAIDLYVDNTASLWTREEGQTRLHAAGRRLDELIADQPGVALQLHALRGEQQPVPLSPRPGESMGAALARSVVPSDARVRLPPATGESKPRWLITDGADPELARALPELPLQRVISVGQQTENGAVTRLSLRRKRLAPGELRGLVQLSHGAQQPSERRLRVSSAGRVLLDERLVLRPGTVVQRSFDAPPGDGPLTATLSPADALPEDDALELAQTRAPELRVTLDAACGAALTRALSTHPAVRLVATGPHELRVSCSSQAPAGSTPALWFPPQASGARASRWDVLPPDAVTELLSPARGLMIRLDMESPELASQPEYAVAIARWLDRASGRALLDWVAEVERPVDRTRITPSSLDEVAAAAVASAPVTVVWTDLALAALVAAALLLCWDLGRVWPRAPAVVGRVCVLGLCALALAAPALPWGRAALELHVLIDDSLSVDRAEAARAWRTVGSAVERLSREGVAGTLTLWRFGAAPVRELGPLPLESDAARALLGAAASPRSQPLDRSGSDLEAALDAVRAQLERGARHERAAAGRVVLMTDALETAGDGERALRALRRLDAGVLALPLASGAASDRWIEAIELPSVARAGDRVQGVATLGSRVAAAGELRVSLDGREVSRQPVQLAARAQQRVGFELLLEGPGVHRVAAVLDTGADDPRPHNDRREGLIDAQGQPHLWYLATAPKPPPLLAGLQAGNWDVAAIAPAELAREADRPPPALIVLDDVALAALPEAGWELLAERVERDGSGLLVLGGPASFAAGGYRRSRLESLLPVTAEARDPEPARSLLVLVDESGSMARDVAGHSRTAFAREIVAGLTQVMGDADLIGLSAFAMQPRQVLPFTRRTEAVERLAPLLSQPSGGTRLGPALDHALERLSGAPQGRRLLALLTDGVVEDADLSRHERALRDARVQLIAFAVGRDVELEALNRLAGAAEDGSVVRVDGVAELPGRVRDAVSARLSPELLGVQATRQVAPLPLEFTADAWPSLLGYAATTARDGARVPLVSERGDPVLALGHAGLGRVAVLPGGLAGWAPDWLAWPGLPGFADALLRALSRPADGGDLHLRCDDRAAGLECALTALDAKGEWADVPEAELSVSTPDDRHQARTLAARAPGAFAHVLPAPTPGVYRVGARVGEQSVVTRVVRSLDHELIAPPQPTSPALLERWERAGLLVRWSQASRADMLWPPRRTTSSRPIALCLALLGFLALLAFEHLGRSIRRRPHGPTSAGAPG